MLWIALVLLLFVWVVGVSTSHTLSGYINILYAAAFILALIRIFMKRHVV
jgi:hypothetical protein